MSEGTSRTLAGRLARAVLLFHDGSPWDLSRQERWLALTGTTTVTPKSLCNFAH